MCIRDSPVSDLVVSYLIFPGSADPEAGPPDYEKLTAKCQELLHDCLLYTSCTSPMEKGPSPSSVKEE